MPMASETYIPTEVTFAGQPLDEVFALTLYNADGDDAHGSMTTSAPPAEAQRGPLAVTGMRDGKQWRLMLPEIEIYHATALGCEFTVLQPVQREAC